MRCIPLYLIALHFVVFYCIVFYCFLLHCILLYSIALHCIVCFSQINKEAPTLHSEGGFSAHFPIGVGGLASVEALVSQHHSSDPQAVVVQQGKAAKVGGSCKGVVRVRGCCRENCGVDFKKVLERTPLKICHFGGG